MQDTRLAACCTTMSPVTKARPEDTYQKGELRGMRQTSGRRPGCMARGLLPRILHARRQCVLPLQNAHRLQVHLVSQPLLQQSQQV